METDKREQLKKLVEQRNKIYAELQLYAPKYHELKNKYMNLCDKIWEIENELKI